MSAESLLILFLGMVGGGCLGFVTAWRLARKLEAHSVKLWKWDTHLDMQAIPVRATRTDSTVAGDVLRIAGRK